MTDQGPRYVILGAGAVGTALAAQLTWAGSEVLLVGRGRQLDHLRAHGLRYQDTENTRTVSLPVTDLEGLRLAPRDALLIAVKTQDVEDLTDRLGGLPVRGGGIASDLPLVTLQNGLEAERIALRRFSRVYAAVVRVPAIYTEIGTVRVPARPWFASISLGRYPAGTDSLSARLVADLTRANALAEERGDIARWKAQKLLHNVRNVVELFSAAPGDSARVGDALVAEAEAVLRTAGHDLATDAERKVSLADWQVLRDPTLPNGQSTWQSFTRGARSEVDYLNGEIVLQARLSGQAAPWNLAAQRLAAALADAKGAPGDWGLDRLVLLAQAGSNRVPA